jgi:hypothetical protein
MEVMAWRDKVYFLNKRLDEPDFKLTKLSPARSTTKTTNKS